MNSEEGNKYVVGYELTHQFVISEENVRKFADATGDFNPLHLDKNYCLSTKFKQPIAHGLLSAAIFSKVYGNIFPGEGSVYVSQTLNFKKPVFLNVPYQAKFKVININRDNGKITIDCQILNAENNVLLEGQSVLYNEMFKIKP